MQAKTDLKPEEIEQIIVKCDACYLGMVSDDAVPYVIPMNFGYQDGILYLHAGPGGKKFEVLKKNNRACAAFSTDHELRGRHEGVACSYFMKYRSVLLHGRIEMIDDYDEKIRALNIMMKKYTGKDDFSYNAPAVNNVQTFRLVVERAEGRSFGY
ncbi:MAG: pyridoxamine 5'-phosphate oxidase family protein [Bacteroidales bacterium]